MISSSKEPLPKDKFEAWIHGLPFWAKDFHLANVLPTAIDWIVLKASGVNATKPSVFAKVLFPNEDTYLVASSSTTFLEGHRLVWSPCPVCSICVDKEHLALSCTKRSAKMPRFGGEKLTFSGATMTGITKTPLAAPKIQKNEITTSPVKFEEDKIEKMMATFFSKQENLIKEMTVRHE